MVCCWIVPCCLFVLIQQNLHYQSKLHSTETCLPGKLTKDNCNKKVVSMYTAECKVMNHIVPEKEVHWMQSSCIRGPTKVHFVGMCVHFGRDPTVNFCLNMKEQTHNQTLLRTICLSVNRFFLMNFM